MEDTSSWLGGVLDSWRTYRRFYAGQTWRIGFCFTGSVLRSLLVVPISMLAQRGIDRGFVRGNRSTLITITLLMVGFYIISAGLGVIVQKTSTRANLRAIGDLRASLARRLHELPRSFVTAQGSSEIQAVIVADTARVGDFSSALINGLVPGTITMVALMTYLVALSPILGLIVVFTVPLAVFVNKRLRSQLEERSRDYRHAYWSFHGTISRSVKLWDLTSSYNAGAEEVARADAAIAGLGTAIRRVDAVSVVYRQLQDFAVSIAGVVVLLVGGLQVQSGSMSLGAFLSFFVVMSLAQASTRLLLNALPQVLMGREALISVHQWVDALHDQTYSGTAPPLLHGSVSFDHVSFSYGSRVVLNDVSVTIEAGSVIAILGVNGAGKTSMINLLLGWYRPTAGRLLAERLTFDDMSMTAWRDMIGLVHQDPAFLNASVLDNLRYGRPLTTLDEIWAAAEMSGSDQMLRSLPLGLDTHIGEGGVLLSGGQRQRIALTRALVRVPQILILDEPTNHLDQEAITVLLNRVTRLPQRPTVILITHDEGVARVVQRSYTLSNGCLTDRCLSNGVTVAVAP